jgi:hypothetical protein
MMVSETLNLETDRDKQRSEKAKVNQHKKQGCREELNLIKKYITKHNTFT